MKHICCLLFVLLTLTSYSQEFPNDWTGFYAGEMIIGFDGRPNDTAQVEFEMLPLEEGKRWSYKMTFKSKQYGDIVKNYETRLIKDSTGREVYVLDELDGILIDVTPMNECTYDMFEVMGQIFSVSMCHDGEGIRYEIFGSLKEGKRVTNSEPDSQGQSFEVTSYKPILHQTVYLKRK